MLVLGNAVAKLLLSLGVGDIIMCDRVGAIHAGRPAGMNRSKDEIALADPVRVRQIVVNLLTNGGRMADYKGYGRAAKPSAERRPSITDTTYRIFSRSASDEVSPYRTMLFR